MTDSCGHGGGSHSSIRCPTCSAPPPIRPLVLVTLGTSVRVRGLPAGLARSAAEAGYEVAVTVEPGTLPGTRGVHEIGFVPLARLLRLPFGAPSPDGAGNHLRCAIISSRWILCAAGRNGRPAETATFR